MKDFGREAGGQVTYSDIDRDVPGQGCVLPSLPYSSKSHYGIRSVLEYISQEDADRAVKELDGRDLRGRPVRVALDDAVCRLFLMTFIAANICLQRGGADNYRRDDRRDDRDRYREDRYRDDRRYDDRDRYRDDRERGYSRRERSRSPAPRPDDRERRPRSPPPRRDYEDRRPTGYDDRRSGYPDRRDPDYYERRTDRPPRDDDRRPAREDDRKERFEDRPPRSANGDAGWSR